MTAPVVLLQAGQGITYGVHQVALGAHNQHQLLWYRNELGSNHADIGRTGDELGKTRNEAEIVS